MANVIAVGLFSAPAWVFPTDDLANFQLQSSDQASEAYGGSSILSGISLRLRAYTTDARAAYDAWALDAMPQATSAEREPSHDFDDDGKANAWEYLLSTNPTLPDSGDILISREADATILSYTRRAELPKGFDVLEHSADAVSYEPLPADQYTREVIPNGVLQTIRLRIPDPGPLIPRFFYRVRLML